MITIDVYGDTGFAASWGWTPNWQEHVDAVKLTAGFKWNASRKVWISEGPEVLLDLDRFGIKYRLTQQASCRAQKFHEQLDSIIALKNTPLPDTPYSFQPIDTATIVEMERGLLTHPRGMGKSRMALDAAAKLGCEMILVIVMFEGTLVYNWPDEVERWHPEWKWVIIPEGGPKAREKFWKETDANVWITNSGKVLLKDWPIEAHWDMVIIDEIGKAKNRKTVTHKRMREVSHRSRYFCGIGSIMETKPEDINAVFDLVRPSVLGDAWRFRQQHLMWDSNGDIIGLTPQGNQLLKERIGPWMIVRDKTILGLPPVISNTNYVEMSPNEQGIYNTLKKQFAKWLRDQQRSETENNALTQMLRFQQFVDSRALLELGKNNASIESFGQHAIFTGSKYQALKEEIAEWQGKVIVFTQFAQMASLLVKWLGAKYYIIGDTEYGVAQLHKRDRVPTVKAFNDDPNEKVLISTDAGAYGLNVKADLIIHYDQLWNPLKMEQRRDRIHGLGRGIEGKVSNEIHLICRGTIDEGKQRVREQRAELVKDIQDGAEASTRRSKLTGSALRRIIEGRL